VEVNVSSGMFAIIEPIIEIVSVGVGVVILFLMRRLVPRFGFLLHRRALRLIMVSALLLVLTELLAFAEAASIGDVSSALALLQDCAELLAIMLMGLAVVTLYRSEREEISPLRRQADMDDLTSLRSRSFFRRAAMRRLELSKEKDIPVACIVVDIDDFKPYNDLYSHEAGDAALRCVAQILRESARADDLPSRYGGDEFVLLINSALHDAAAVAERVRLEVEQRCSPDHDASMRRRLTVSLGVAPLTAKVERIEDLVRAADLEMYRAKRAGKNRVAVAGEA
jgi:diguanylate cyclase (GGDEF)-like protein